MLWSTLVPWTVLCLAGFVKSDDDDDDFIYWYPGRRKLASIDEYEPYELYEPRSDYLHMYTDEFPQNRENYDPDLIADSDSTEDVDVKRKQRMYFTESSNYFLKNYLTYTKLSLYNRNQKPIVIRSNEWFKNFDKDKDLVIMVHGVSRDANYVENFFNTIASALLQNGDFNVIGIDWRYFISKEEDIFDIERNAQEAIKIGHVLNSVVKRAMNPKYPAQVPKTSYIGHDMGSIPVVVHSTAYGFTFDSVYGLNPRSNLGSNNYLTLTQLHGNLVNTLSTLYYPYTLSHRDYRPVYNKDFNYGGNYGTLAYQILAKAIMYGNMTARFCSSEQDYVQGYCSRLTEVPLWYRQMSISCGDPVGKYYFELPKPKSRPYCDGQTFIQGGNH